MIQENVFDKKTIEQRDLFSFKAVFEVNLLMGHTIKNYI